MSKGVRLWGEEGEQKTGVAQRVKRADALGLRGAAKVPADQPIAASVSFIRR